MVVLYYRKQCEARILSPLLRGVKSQLMPVITPVFIETICGI
jgi:hypothetical protein